MQTRRVYRDFTVLLVSGVMNLRRYQEMLEGLGFGRLKATAEDRQAVGLIKRLKPDLVITERQLSVFSGLHLLSAARQDEERRQTPFLIIGVAEDLKSPDIIKKIEDKPPAKLIASPLNEESLAQAVADLLDLFVDWKKEEAYTKFDSAREKAGEGELEEAAELYRQGLAISEEDIDAWLELAGVLVKLKQTKSAEQAYQRALDIDNASLRAFFGLADLYEERGETSQVVEVLREALEMARRMIKASGQHTARINYYIGEFELRLIRSQQAEKAFKEAIKDDPENAELRADIGDSYADKGFHAEAEEYYEAALEMKPDLAHVFNRLGISLRKQGKFDKALQHYQKARRHHHDDEHLLFNIARTHLEAGNLQSAKDFLEQALKLAPELKEARLLLEKLEGEGFAGEPRRGIVEGNPPDEPEDGGEAN